MKDLKFTMFWGLVLYYFFRVCQFGRLLFLGYAIFDRYFLGVSFQNKAFCKVF